eukprot:TRINITY_DN3127_c0_g1_i1.p1 TRINITY_DN3127_c0_g1~~TRINITY_DN3127_c0_g1_i1.p1  ORF type:complete len:206 (+),score=20.12 TRINITY_DN3127_c0_g1_i1:71-619(+)
MTSHASSTPPMFDRIIFGDQDIPAEQREGYRRMTYNALVLIVLTLVILIPALYDSGAMHSAPPFVGIRLLPKGEGGLPAPSGQCLQFTGVGSSSTYAFFNTSTTCSGTPALTGSFSLSPAPPAGSADAEFPGMARLTMRDTTNHVGTYAYTYSGGTLDIRTITDECTTRKQFVGRPWSALTG